MLDYLKQKDAFAIRFLKTQKRRLKNFYISIQRVPSLIGTPKGKCNFDAMHIAALSNGNAGDVLLPIVLRDLFRSEIGVGQWYLRSVSKNVDSIDVRTYNKRSLVVVGGGGLFLKDTNPNDLSGWQWPCDIEHLEKITAPIVMFAVGYNRFRGQNDFAPIFTEHLNAFVEKAMFVGIRNHGSIEKLKPYLRNEQLQSKLQFQPCMTTLISKIYPDLLDYSRKEDFVALNCAFDRSSCRSNTDEILCGIADAVKKLSATINVKYYVHTSSDKTMLPFLDRALVPYEIVELNSAKEIIEAYAKPRLVIGMRGHSQMIPFGCNTPILSIISHDKMQWFLEDIDHPEWGVDVLNENFADVLLQKASFELKNYQSCMQEIKIQQEKLWNITLENLNYIKERIK